MNTRIPLVIFTLALSAAPLLSSSRDRAGGVQPASICIMDSETTDFALYSIERLLDAEPSDSEVSGTGTRRV
jgi:hypothetical protein